MIRPEVQCGFHSRPSRRQIALFQRHRTLVEELSQPLQLALPLARANSQISEAIGCCSPPFGFDQRCKRPRLDGTFR